MLAEKDGRNTNISVDHTFTFILDGSMFRNYIRFIRNTKYGVLWLQYCVYIVPECLSTVIVIGVFKMQHLKLTDKNSELAAVLLTFSVGVLHSICITISVIVSSYINNGNKEFH